jgi:hypothetical protein
MMILTKIEKLTGVINCSFIKLIRFLSAWAWKNEIAALRRASILREIANQSINQGVLNETWYMGILEASIHCQTGEPIWGYENN